MVVEAVPVSAFPVLKAGEPPLAEPELPVALVQAKSSLTAIPTSAICGEHESLAVGAVAVVLFGVHFQPVVQPLLVAEVVVHVPVVQLEGLGCGGGCGHGWPSVPWPQSAVRWQVCPMHWYPCGHC